jgi:hypothetical protein
VAGDVDVLEVPALVGRGVRPAGHEDQTGQNLFSQIVQFPKIQFRL